MPLMKLAARCSAIGARQELEHHIRTHGGSVRLFGRLRLLWLRLRLLLRRPRPTGASQVLGARGMAAGRCNGRTLRVSEPARAQPVAKVVLPICASTAARQTHA